ncbi:MAG: galactonate dehydratase [Verrucomicrobia bacterium]|nr:galactonate dehydratase [Verrucomicrobiota bacterium]
MKITALKPCGLASPVSDWTYVKVETDEPGLHGWGECSLPGKTHGVQGAIRDLEKLILGADPLNTERAWQRMYRHGYWRGGPIQTSALSGVDMALWDIRGKAAGKPVYQLLGGAVREKIQLYANCGLATDPAEFRRRVRGALDQGYRVVKIYPLPAVGPVEGAATLRQIVACCEAVREEIGPDRDFALDFHGRCTASLAVQIEASVRHTQPLWIEEPTPAEAPDALRRCAEKFVLPIAAGERLFTRWAFRALLEQELVGIIQPDVANAGGVTELAKIASLAELYGVAFNPHNPNGPLQSLASLHLAAHAQAFGLLEHRHEHHDFMRRFCSVVPKVDATGHASLPPGPGLGADLDEDFLGQNPAVVWTPEAFRADGSISDW